MRANSPRSLATIFKLKGKLAEIIGFVFVCQVTSLFDISFWVLLYSSLARLGWLPGLRGMYSGTSNEQGFV